MSVKINTKAEQASTQNVVGVIEPNDPNQSFFRSDHFHYALKGIPIISYTDGEHEDYHRPSDSPDRIDYEQMMRISRTIFMTATELANAPTRPRVDKKLPFDQ